MSTVRLEHCDRCGYEERNMTIEEIPKGWSKITVPAIGIAGTICPNCVATCREWWGYGPKIAASRERGKETP